MSAGVRSTKRQVLFFADADVIGLSAQVVTDILSPVLEGKHEMVVAMRYRGIYRLPFVLSLTPHLGGERVVTRRLWRRVPKRFKNGFKIEAALNHFAGQLPNGFGYVLAVGLTQVTKEAKRGFVHGITARLAMCVQVSSAYLELAFLPLLSARSGTKAWLSSGPRL